MPTASRDAPAPLVGRMPTWSHEEARSSGVWLERAFVAPTRGVDMEHDTAVRDWSVPLEVRLGEQRWIALPGESLTIGRDPDASVRINDGQVSRCHATLDPTAHGWLLTDHSRNGVFLEGRRTAQLLITTPTAVALGHPVDGVVITMTPIAGDAAPRTAASTHATRTGVHDVVGTSTTIGRLPENDVVVDDLLVSRHHAVLNCTPGGSYIRDLGSANGTYLNGQRVTQASVAEGDRIGVGHALLHLSGNRLVEYQDQGDVDLEAEDLVVTRDGRRLLDGVGLEVPQRSLLAILGPSGSGKSTLLGALAGTRPADTGRVRYGGRDLYDDYDELRQRIGLVPQDDILHPQLRVRPALSYAARLRFPPDVPRSDRRPRRGGARRTGARGAGRAADRELVGRPAQADQRGARAAHASVPALPRRADLRARPRARQAGDADPSGTGRRRANRRGRHAQRVEPRHLRSARRPRSRGTRGLPGAARTRARLLRRRGFRRGLPDAGERHLRGLPQPVPELRPQSSGPPVALAPAHTRERSRATRFGSRPVPRAVPAHGRRPPGRPGVPGLSRAPAGAAERPGACHAESTGALHRCRGRSGGGETVAARPDPGWRSDGHGELDPGAGQGADDLPA